MIDVNDNEFRDFSMSENISVDSSAIDTTAADIQIPCVTTDYPSFENSITEMVEKPEDENDKANDEDNQDS